MRMVRFVRFILITILLGSSGYIFAQERGGCELKARIEIESAPGSSLKNRAIVRLESGATPVKYVFYEEASGRLLQKDFSKNSVSDLQKGSYYCIVVDDKGCTKKIQFQIQ